MSSADIGRGQIQIGRSGLPAALPGVRPLHLAVLLVLLPMIFGSFQYVVDVYPLYALSKLLPLLLSPLAIVAYLTCRLPYRGWFLALGLYSALLTSFISAVDFGEGIAAAITTQVKLLPITYYFSFYLILSRLRPSHRELSRAFAILGLVSLALLPVLWVIVPDAVYHLGDEFTKLFIYDEDRGYRITLPLFFVEIFVLYENRRFWATRNPLHIATIIAAFLLMGVFYKERMQIAGLFVIMVAVALSGQSLQRRLAVLLLAAAIAVPATLGIGYFSSLGESGSVTVRQATINLAIATLNNQPLGWLIGLGTVSHFREQSLAALYGHNFFLADIGMLGMVYEYGLIGTALFLVIFWKILLYFKRGLAFTRDPFLHAFRDQIWFQLLTAILLPITFSPAEWAATFGLLVYFRRRLDERLGPTPPG